MKKNRPSAIIRLLLPNKLKQVLRISRGFFLYHFVSRKTIVLITGGMRSGTTLLKALLGEAPDVSHIEEIYYGAYRKYNRYNVYRQIYDLSKKTIIVLKCPQYQKCPFPKKFIKLKIIVLTRNIMDCVVSVKKMTYITNTLLEFRDNKRAIDYWCHTYESILNDREISSHDTVYIKYEDLVENPKEVTKRLFSFIGSSYNKGVDSYKKPDSGGWIWGKDDAGDKINALKVAKPHNNGTRDEELLKLLKNSERVRGLMNIFGYHL